MQSLRLTLLLLLLIRAAPARAAEVRFVPVGRETVESRLARFAKANAERQLSLWKIFEEAGCEGERLQKQAVKQSKLPNIVCVLPGATDAVIVVGAHFDHTTRGDGVVDNWTGASLLPSLFQSLREEPRRHTFVFVGFTDEEQGLVGSRFHARQLSEQDAAHIRAMINLDSLGLSGTKVWLSHADRKLAEALYAVAQSMKLPLSQVNVERVGTSDSEPFVKRKIPALTIHSVTQETFPILHTDRDRMEAIRLDDYYDSYRLIAAFLAYLDGTLQ